MEEGAVSDLQSTYPYVTALAWAGVFSGMNPGKHGIFDLLQIGAEVVKAPNMRSCEVPFL
jgi:predicted AlkP superfamily phosphohydrolase/phosphomutase